MDFRRLKYHFLSVAQRRWPSGFASASDQFGHASNKVANVRNRLSRGWPIPPPNLIFKVIGNHNMKGFLESGAGHARLINEVLERNDGHPAKFHSVLDFGCGVARVLRHFTDLSDTALYGTDHDPELITWCRNHLPFARFDVNELAGGLAYDNEKFDFIYLLSVFTHLDEAQQLFWIDELARVLKPGGYLYVTMHGASQFCPRTTEEAERFANGELVTRIDGPPGSNHVNSFASRAFMVANLAKQFRLLEYLQGGNPAQWKSHAFQPQDSYLLKKSV